MTNARISADAAPGKDSRARRARRWPRLDQRLRANMTSLFSLQIVNYAVPLVTLPWLTRVLGPDGYGRIGFVMAVAGYLVLLVDYGFNLSATNKIAVHRHDRAHCSRIFWATLGAKALLGLAALVLLLALIALVPRFTALSPLLLIGFIAVLGSILTPVWFYQGLEHMEGFATINAIIRLASVPLVFALVRGPGDIIAAVVIQAGVIGLAGLINLATLVARKEIAKPDINVADCLQAMRDGSGLFLAQAGVSLYTAANIVILGLMTSNQEVAYFAAAAAVMRATHGMITPLTTALFPHVSHMMVHQRQEALHFVRTITRSLGLVTLMIALLIFAGSPFVVKLLFGAQFAPAAGVLRWLAPTVLIIALSNLFGVQTMVPLGRTRAFTGILLGAGLFNMILIIPLAFYFGASGAAASIAATELCVTISMALYLWKQCPGSLRAERGAACRV